MQFNIDSELGKLVALTLLQSPVGHMPAGTFLYTPIFTPLTLRVGQIFTVEQDKQALFSDPITVESGAEIRLELGAVLKQVT